MFFYSIFNQYSLGASEEITIQVDQAPAVKLHISPDAQRSIIRLSLFGTPLYNSIQLPFSSEELLSLPVQEVIELTAGRIQWSLLIPLADVYAYKRLERIAQSVRSVLPRLADAEDGAMNSEGQLVRIETEGLASMPGFNCSGFAKFVADGIYYARTAKLLDIPLLKTKHFSLRGNTYDSRYEESRDPYFGLDWTRNIAMAVGSLETSNSYNPESFDVRNIPFLYYTEDKGYRVQDIRQALYLDSIANPGRIYLASVNGHFGNNPRLWQHYHVQVFLPYFDSEGIFHIALMERNFEGNVETLEQRYPNEYIHLVALEPSEDYALPEIKF